MNMQNDKLLPCPFCGGEAIINEDFDIDITYQAMCSSCFCKTRFFATTKSAVITWNTRKPMKRIVEKLEKKINPLHNVNWNSAIECSIDIVKWEGGIE
jgi:Lar family restriction alleviation protein